MTLNPVENITSYTTPNVNGYGLEWYNDEEGEFKLFDGEIPDEDMLAVAVSEAVAEDGDAQRMVCLEGLDRAGKDRGLGL